MIALCERCQKPECRRGPNAEPWDDDWCNDRTRERLTTELELAKANIAALQADLDQANQTIEDLRERGIK
jgi:hypothetical protein